MRARFRAPGARWRTGNLDIKRVVRRQRHTILTVQIAGRDGTTVCFEIKDRDIYRLADALVDSYEEVHLPSCSQRGA